MVGAAGALALPLRAQVLVAARPGCPAAVGALTQRSVWCAAALGLHALAAQVLVRARKPFLTETTEILLLATQPICTLLTAMISLWRINARFLACSR